MAEIRRVDVHGIKWYAFVNQGKLLKFQTFEDMKKRAEALNVELDNLDAFTDKYNGHVVEDK